MLIYKVPDNVIYDTTDKNCWYPVKCDHPYIVPLALVLSCEVRDYLVQVFNEPSGIIKNHILYNFSTSQYFVTNSLCAIP